MLLRDIRILNILNSGDGFGDETLKKSNALTVEIHSVTKFQMIMSREE
jgi:hypothetical protein